MSNSPHPPRSAEELIGWLDERLGDVGSVVVEGELIEIRHSKAGAWGEIATRDHDGRLRARFPWIGRWNIAQQLRGYKGRNVRLTGTLTAHPLYGPLRISVEKAEVLDRAETDTSGMVDAAAATAQRRLALPTRLSRVGVVVPATDSAGIGDFYGALGNVEGLFVEEHRSRMAGPAAGNHIARAILVAANSCQIVVALRGGGSAADLAAWDSPDVVEAIAAAGVPVIVAVGHTRDRHKADEAAFASLPTPTAAGTWVRQLGDGTT